ncbi:hypothetical protein [Limnoglobus roseus]|uniref:Uncharacterized protein n=1 Tax=Limnoglobus roseus TaxID=2598579 RepID=A0A5C1AP58_9BACT|nr:hypothetical protein [Limnoglobus roseus]QEL19004.1 hypothetical protein PX52LOC_06054 [Limnoglobus roseus]
MAYLMPYTDRNGVTFPESVWMPLNILPVFYPNPYALVTFLGFATPEIAARALAVALNGQGKMPEAIGLKDYRASAAQLRVWATGRPDAGTRLGDVWELAYAVQRASNDTLDPMPDEPLRMGNFFARATWVDLEQNPSAA